MKYEVLIPGLTENDWLQQAITDKSIKQIKQKWPNVEKWTEKNGEIVGYMDICQIVKIVEYQGEGSCFWSIKVGSSI